MIFCLNACSYRKFVILKMEKGLKSKNYADKLRIKNRWKRLEMEWNSTADIEQKLILKHLLSLFCNCLIALEVKCHRDPYSYFLVQIQFLYILYDHYLQCNDTVLNSIKYKCTFNNIIRHCNIKHYKSRCNHEQITTAVLNISRCYNT